MRKNLTEIVFILDRSGSMSGLEGPVKIYAQNYLQARLSEVNRQ